ncbi:MAG: DUF1566 domain-containing protein [Syntrophales bacterium]|nr:DUF1566 domain-containing protein [Syntrophales bacterium]
MRKARYKNNTAFPILIVFLTVFFVLSPMTLLAGSPDQAKQEELSWTDPSTKLMWYRHGYRSYRNLYGGAQPASWKAVNEWIHALNANRTGGFSDWRLPSAKEYATLFENEAGAPVYDYRNSREIELYRLGYRHEIKGLKRYAWSGEQKGGKVVCYDFVEDRTAAYDASLDITYEFDALAVRTITDK